MWDVTDTGLDLAHFQYSRPNPSEISGPSIIPFLVLTADASSTAAGNKPPVLSPTR